MSAESVLWSYEEQAEDNLTPSDNQVSSGGILYSGGGKNSRGKKKLKSGGNLKKFGALGFIMIALLFFVVVFSVGNLIPSAISNRLLEETDVQYADAIMSKEIVFQEALRQGDIPDNTAELLKSDGVTVGYLDKSGEFVEGNQYSDGLVLKIGNDIITAEQFIDKVNSDAVLYNAFNKATYARGAYWYDDSAKEVMKAYGTNRNNYSNNEDFETVMKNKLKSGNDISVTNVAQVEEEKINSDGTKSTEVRDVSLESLRASDEASEFVAKVGGQNSGVDSVEATLNAADELKAADTISNEQRSGLFYLLFMENISKMQAGDGNSSRINEAMNYLYESSTNKIVDVNTGEVIEVSGTALDSPSMYAILSGEDVKMDAVNNYSNDRILITIENKLDKNNGSISNTITSSDRGVKGVIGRLFGLGGEQANQEVLNSVSPTVSRSLIKNDIDNINGVVAGEMLVEGAVSVGKDLAKYSGATAGDADSVSKYARLTEDILAIDAAADRLNRSPFDITSKNTFLGSIVYNFAISVRYSGSSKGVLSNISSVIRTTSRSLGSILFGNTFADQSRGYLNNYGDCKTIGTIAAVGSPQCSMVATFDTSTLDDPLHNSEYLAFVQNNTEGNGESIINNTKLANFIKNSIRRTTPVGITDGGILTEGIGEINSNDSVPFVTNISAAISGWFNNTFNTEVKRAATGELFVNSSTNNDWSTYKWAQRYVSLARAQDSLRKYAVNYDGRVAYDIDTLSGTNNPVIAFIRQYCSDDTVVADNN